jgi:protein-S-isoprenylcysteine O-methyltransferase
MLVRIGAVFVVLVVWRTAGLGKVSDRIRSLFLEGGQPAMLALPYLGSVICALGVAIAIWARFHLGANWSSHPALKVGHQLVTTGPYALVRHPIYTGMIAGLAGTALVALPALIILPIVVIVFVWRVHREESLMLGQFPDEYPAYQARTWALIPFVW